MLDICPKTIADLGCGMGAIYDCINWEFDKFYALDLAQNLLNNHGEKNVIKQIKDFNKNDFLDDIYVDLIISASALQWAKDLENVIRIIKEHSRYQALAIFTNKTLQTLRKWAKTSHDLPSLESLENLAQKNDFFMQIKDYKIDFNSKNELFAYIKNSGISGGARQLNISQTKALLKAYPHRYLEFQAVFLLSNNIKPPSNNQRP